MDKADAIVLTLRGDKEVYMALDRNNLAGWSVFALMGFGEFDVL